MITEIRFCLSVRCIIRISIDTDMLNSEAQDFIGTHDFSAFCAAGSSVEGKIRTVKNASVIRNNEIIEVTFEADGFLYNMVRIMVGTLLDINRGKIVPGSIPQIIESKDRNQSRSHGGTGRALS